jgi:hypothetical protein
MRYMCYEWLEHNYVEDGPLIVLTSISCLFNFFKILCLQRYYKKVATFLIIATLPRMAQKVIQYYLITSPEGT